MDGKRLKGFWENDVKAMLEIYTQFETLIPNSSGKNGSDHNGEDGRYVENILKYYIKKYLPKDLEILTGFIVRPAVACGRNKSRKNDEDKHSTQLDLIVYDTAHFPVFLRIDDTAIVPPEGVVAIISLKKHLRQKDIIEELPKLKNAVELCAVKDLKKPFTALVSMSSDISSREAVFDKIEQVHKDTVSYDEMIGYIGTIKEWSIYKRKKKKIKEAEYRTFEHLDNNSGRGFEYLIKKIHDVYYSEKRNTYKEPGFVALGSKNEDDSCLGSIKYHVETRNYSK